MKVNTIEEKLLKSLSAHSERHAVEYGQRRMTYKELEAKAEQIALTLQQQGVESGTFVGLLLEDRMNLIVALVGILRAGCAFVPLDTALPDGRLATLIDTLNLETVICDRYEHPPITRSLMFNDFFKQSGDSNGDRAEIPDFQREGPVYVYFTSGTTGTPKGVVGRNKGLLHFIEWEIEEFGVDESFRVSQLTTPGFDVYMRDVLMPLCAGATICIPSDRDILYDGELLSRWIHKSDIHMIHCVPSIFRTFNTEQLSSDMFPHLKYILMAGERIVPSELSRWYDVIGSRVQLVNIYGPTETTLAKLFYRIEPEDVNRSNMPVGKTIPGARVIVLDERMDICRESMVGEVYIRTPYRSLGYWNNEDMNRDRFIPNPFNDDPNDLIYKTGDLGRLLPDGNLELTGRVDRQVKIRGMRIELEEIESVLSKVEEVKEVAVIKQELSPENHRLVAFVSGIDETSNLERQLMVDMSRQLPEYMIPAKIVTLETFPRKPNGKVDYSGLTNLIPAGEEIVAPRDKIEEELSEIWAEVLKADGFGVTDTFFNVGGNSLNLMTLITKIHSRFKLKLTLGEVFNQNTIEKQAFLIKEMAREEFAPVTAAEKRDYYPLTSAQLRLFVLQQMDGVGTSYNLPQIILLPAGRDMAVVKGIFEKLTERHEGLRTYISVVDGQPAQRILSQMDVSIETVDSLDQFIRPFDLSQPPLFRVGVMRKEKGWIQLLVDLHHIIADGLSLEILERDFLSLYRGHPLPPLPARYVDYAVWQATEMHRDTLMKQKKFWLDVFKDDLEVLDMATDFPRPAIRDFSGDTMQSAWGEEELRGLRDVCASQEATGFMVLLAVYYILLYKLSGQLDMVVGTPVAGRRHDDLENIIGMFVNTLPLRVRLAENLPFSQFLQQVKKFTLQAMENQEYPFEDLVDQLELQRDTSRNPLFDVVFAYNLQQTSSDKLYERPTDSDNLDMSKFDLNFTVVELTDQLMLKVEYSSALFNRQSVERFAGMYRDILNAVIADIHVSCEQIDVVSPETKQWILEDLNGTATDYPDGSAIHRLVQTQVEVTPDAIALSYEDIQLTYMELGGQARALSAVLEANRTGAGDIVAIMSGPCPEMIVGILGILSAGAAYLPVNPSYPIGRQRYMLKDTGAKLMLTTGHEACELDIKTHMMAPFGEEAPRADWPDNSRSDDLAYIIYTSGSTGNPKGVMVNHRHIGRLVKNTDYYEFSPGKHLLQTGALEFDASTFEIWGSLANGMRLCLMDKDYILEATRLKRALRRLAIDVLFMSTPLFMRLTDQEADLFASLSSILIGGDVIDPRKVERQLQTAPKTKFIHVYGPTENTTYSTYCPIDDCGAGRVPIGRAIANSTAYIVDPRLNLTPPGVAGELLVGGDGVARGYLNHPELTFEKFIPDPFGSGGYLYKTGDMARLLDNGDIEFLGRIDKQLKISGYRIEPGEIETHLHHHTGIRQAKVLPIMANGEKFLRAYLVMNEELSPGSLRSWLGERLPDYMIPSEFVVIEAMPLTVGGKVDIAKLKQSGTRMVSAQQFVAPRDDLEQAIAEAWKEVLGIEKVGIYDNFFEINGNSLKIVTLHEKLKEKLDRDVSVTTLFRFPSIHSLSQYLASEADKKQGADLGRKRVASMARGKELKRQRMNKKKGAVNES
jgi:amino acid adenylation domain-containing protein